MRPTDRRDSSGCGVTCQFTARINEKEFWSQTRCSTLEKGLVALEKDLVAYMVDHHDGDLVALEKDRLGCTMMRTHAVALEKDFAALGKYMVALEQDLVALESDLVALEKDVDALEKGVVAYNGGPP